MASEDIWNFEPTEKQIEDVRKKWGTLQILTLERYIIGKVGVNLCPKVEKAIFFALASIAEKGQYKAEIVGDEYIIKTVLDVVKKHKGKIGKIGDIQKLLREIYYALSEVEDTMGSEKFSRLERCIRGTSVTEKLRNVVTPQKLIDKREALAQKIEEVCDTINNYFNSENEKGQSYLNDKDMVKLKNKIDSMRSRKYKGKPYNLKKDIDVDSFYRITTIDSAIETLDATSNLINFKRNLEEKKDLYKEDLERKKKLYKESLKRSMTNNPGGAKDDYFNAYGNAHEGRPITNTHKALLLLIFALAKGDGNAPTIRRPITEPFLKANSFSEIDESRLKQMNAFLEKTTLDFAELLTIYDDFSMPMGIFSKMVEPRYNSNFCQNDLSFLKKMSSKFKTAYENAVKGGHAPKFSYSEYQDIFKDIFIGRKFIVGTLKGFKASLNEEMADREKGVQKVAIMGKKGSMDDSLLDIIRTKALECKTFNEVEDLLLYYTTAQGGDLINSFLRGDLSVFGTENVKLKSSFGTNQKVSVSLLLNTMLQALKLKNTIMYGTIDTQIKVYRGLGFERLLYFINVDKSKLEKNTGRGLKNIGRLIGRKLKNIDRLIEYINQNKPIYSADSMTSTTTQKNIAVGHALKHVQRSGSEFGVVMSITLNKNTSFGKDLSTTTFGPDDKNKEVILKPQQKIKLIRAKKYFDPAYEKTVVEVECQA